MMNEKTAALEAMLFLNGEAVERKVLCGVLDVEDKELDLLIESLKDELLKAGAAFEILTLDSRVQMAVKERFLPYMQKMTGAKKISRYRLRLWRFWLS